MVIVGIEHRLESTTDREFKKMKLRIKLRPE